MLHPNWPKECNDCITCELKLPDYIRIFCRFATWYLYGRKIFSHETRTRGISRFSASTRKVFHLRVFLLLFFLHTLHATIWMTFYVLAFFPFVFLFLFFFLLSLWWCSQASRVGFRKKLLRRYWPYTGPLFVCVSFLCVCRWLLKSAPPRRHPGGIGMPGSSYPSPLVSRNSFGQTLHRDVVDH